MPQGLGNEPDRRARVPRRRSLPARRARVSLTNCSRCRGRGPLRGGHLQADGRAGHGCPQSVCKEPSSVRQPRRLAIAVDTGPGPPRQQPLRALPAARRHGPKPARWPAHKDRPSRRLTPRTVIRRAIIMAKSPSAGSHVRTYLARQVRPCWGREAAPLVAGCKWQSGRLSGGDAEDPGPALKFRRWRAQPAALPGCRESRSESPRVRVAPGPARRLRYSSSPLIKTAIVTTPKPQREAKSGPDATPSRRPFRTFTLPSRGTK
jgi:hypothetical protein